MTSDLNPTVTAFVAGFAGATLALTLHRSLLANKIIKCSSSAGKPIKRIANSERGSAIVVHNGVVSLSGQVAEIPLLDQSDIKEQTRQTLKKIEKLLEQAGTDRKHILTSQIWLKDIKKDFAPMNEVWNAWVGEYPDHKGTRACVEAEMARPAILVEIKVTAAIPE